MAKDIYVGVNGAARAVKSQMVGVAGVTRNVVRAYVGVNGAARECFSIRGYPDTATCNATIYMRGRKLSYYQTQATVEIQKDTDARTGKTVYHGTFYPPRDDPEGNALIRITLEGVPYSVYNGITAVSNTYSRSKAITPSTSPSGFSLLPNGIVEVAYGVTDTYSPKIDFVFILKE